jgi:penicillin-binding protein 1B
MQTHRVKISPKVRKIIIWGSLAGIVALAALFIYCAALFQELEPLMSQNLKSQPSVIYSDYYVLHKGEPYSDSFLTERLKDLRLSFSEAGDGNKTISWPTQNFDYPTVVLPADSPLRLGAGHTVTVETKDDRVDSIKVDGNSVDAVVIDPTPIAQIAGAGHEIRNYARLEEIPTKLLQAIISIEDQRFLEHIGFDIRSLARAVWVNLRSHALSQGGSTITQQLVKNLLGTSQKTLFRKVRELVLAILIEARYSKDTILEKYLNEVYVGQIGSLEIHGVSEAARYLYNKPLDKLSLSEMALIAGIIRGPAYYSPYKYQKRALERKDTVLRKMGELHIITEPELKAALAEVLVFAPPSTVNNKAPYFVDYVKAQIEEELSDRLSAEDLSAQGLRVFTTLDVPLQRRADQAVATTVKDLEARYKIERPLRLESLLVTADHKTGFLRALVGGRSYFETTFNRVLNMKRQVGSTFKPIAYLAAFLKGRDARGIPYSGAYMVDDEPWSYSVKGTRNATWVPHNYEKGYRGHITLREAFENSINIPMARIGVEVGIDHIIETAQKLGIREPLPQVASLSLGSVDLNPIDLLQAYSTFANRGERVALTAIRAVLDENGRVLKQAEPSVTREFDAPVMDVIGDLMQGVVKQGTAKSMATLGYTKTARGKTGTTSFSRDAWFAGFSQGLATVTWTGFDELKTPDSEDDDAVKKFKSPAPLTGAGAALPTWARFYAQAKPSKLEEIEPPLDSSIETRRIDKSTGQLAKPTCPPGLIYNEVFLPNSVPAKECSAH